MEVNRVNVVVIKRMLLLAKEASSVLRVIARCNEGMKGMDVVINCIGMCDAEAFQAESVLKAHAPAAPQTPA
jgi:hypothetical protein